MMSGDSSGGAWSSFEQVGLVQIRVEEDNGRTYEGHMYL